MMNLCGLQQSRGMMWCRTSRATKARCLYGQIPEEHWSYPSWVSPQEAAVARKGMRERGILYGGRESYHHMCRYFSGFIHKHPLLKEYDYYWRMEPDVHYYCDLDYDPFLYMKVSFPCHRPPADTCMSVWREPTACPNLICAVGKN